jgi:pimeloyl-ACP methyl ester carboxylesterase
MLFTKSASQNEFLQYTLPDGRRLAWCERGDLNGSPVFAFHGLPGSRLQVHPDESIARNAGARVIHVDRPGFGRSDPMAGRGLSDWADDIRRLADHLRMGRFAVAGVSGGGPYAWACAARLRDRVTRAAIVSGVGPRDSMLGSKSGLVRVGFGAASRAPWLFALPMALAAAVGARAPAFYLDRLIKRLPESDRRILRRPEMRAMLVRDLAEAFRNGPWAFLQDLQLEAQPWGIALEQVCCPVALWHGSSDTVVPPSATQALVALVPHATVKMFPDAGHFFVFEVWRDILDWLLGS